MVVEVKHTYHSRKETTEEEERRIEEEEIRIEGRRIKEGEETTRAKNK